MLSWRYDDKEMVDKEWLMSGSNRKRNSPSLSKVLLQIDSEEMAEQFLEVFLTESEREKLQSRLRAAVAIANSAPGVSQEEFASQTECAIGVIGRLSRGLRRHENSGLSSILKPDAPR